MPVGFVSVGYYWQHVARLWKKEMGLEKNCEKKNGLEDVQKFGDLKGWKSQVFQDPKW